MRTPPGWYPDPGHTGIGPALERWWDGETWTEHSRAAEGPPPAPGFLPQPPGTPPPGRPRGPVIAAISGAVAVVLALIVGGVVIAGSGSDDDGGDEAKKQPTPTAPESTGPSDDGPTDAPTEDPTDGPTDDPDANRMTPATGVVLPLLDGWTRSPGFQGASVNGRSYTCPGDKPERCVRAGAIVLNAQGSGSAESVARADIAVNAESSYSEEFYGGIESHTEVEAEKVDVAGEDGYRVRWKIDNKVDPDAYVESVAFPHPDGSGRMLLLRSGFDIHDDAPPLSHMDKLVEGVKEGQISEDDSSEQV